jgi:hypothetical protein
MKAVTFSAVSPQVNGPLFGRRKLIPAGSDKKRQAADRASA